MRSKHRSDEAFETWVTSGGGGDKLRTHAVQAAFREGWNAREKAPHTLIIDTSDAHMVPIPNSSAAAPSVFIVETQPRNAPLPEGARKYLRDVPQITTVIHKGVTQDACPRCHTPLNENGICLNA